MNNRSTRPFNSSLETGIRSLCILVSSYPSSFDLQDLVVFDHLVVHTGDLGGPESLHPKLPLRSAELLVRRGLIEKGLLLMISRRLIERQATHDGIFYQAGEFSETFLISLSSTYILELRTRTDWVIKEFGNLSSSGLKAAVAKVFDNWLEEFQLADTSLGGNR